MSPDRLKALLASCRDGLLYDTLPFWIPRAIDRQHGGYLTALDRDGSLLQADKSVWVQGRFAWLLATSFDTVERRGEWLELSKHGIDFINRCCFDADGRMFFSVTKDGRLAEAPVSVLRGVRGHRAGRVRTRRRRRTYRTSAFHSSAGCIRIDE